VKKIIVGLSICLLLTGISYATETASDIFQEANSYYFKKDFINAIKYFRKVINDFPANSYTDHSLFGLGSSFYELENYRDAIAVYSQLIEEFPNSSFSDDALFRIGECYEKIGEYKNAHIYYSKLINQYPNSLLAPQSREKINKFASLLLKPEQNEIKPEKAATKETDIRIPVQSNVETDIKTSGTGKIQVSKPEVNISGMKKNQENRQPVNIVPVRIPEQSTAKSGIPEPVQSGEKLYGAEKKIFEKQYVIRPDDTLTSIAEKFYGDFNLYTRIADYNNIKNPTNIKIGETILIPFEKDFAEQRNSSGYESQSQTDSRRDLMSDLDAESQVPAAVKPVEINKTDEAYIYSYKLEKERKNYEQLLSIEKEKRRQLLEKIRNLETQIARLNLEIDTYKNNLNSLQDLKVKLTDLEKTNSDLIESLKLQKQKEIIREAKNKTELLKLQRDLDDLTTKYNVAKTDFESKKYVEMITQKDQQLAQASVLISQLNNKIQTIESDNLNFRNQIDRLQRDIIAANEYRTKAADYEQKLADKEKSLSAFEDSMKKLTASNKNLSDSVAEIQAKFENASKEKDRFDKLNKEISEKLSRKETELVELGKQIQSVNAELADLKSSYQTKTVSSDSEKLNYKKTIDELTSNNKFISDELIKFKNRLIDLQKETISSKEDKTKTQQKSSVLEAQVKTLNATIEKLNKESDLFKTELNGLKEKYETSETGWKNKEVAYQSEIAAVKMQNAGMSANLKKKDDDYRTLESELLALRELSKRTDSETVKKLKDLNEKLNTQLALLQNEINALQKQYSGNSLNRELREPSFEKKDKLQTEHISGKIKDSEKSSIKTIEKESAVKSDDETGKRGDSARESANPALESAHNSSEKDLISKMEIERNKKSAKEFIAKGVIFKNKGDFQNAELCYKKALELDSENADAYNHLGFLYTESDKNLDIAIELVNKAVELNSGDKGYYYDTLGWIYFKQGLFQKSKKYISDAIELIPQTDKQALASVYYHLGMVYVKLNDPNNAFFQFIEVLKLAPNSTAALKSKQQLDLL